MTLKELRKSYGITQMQASILVKMPLRTYVRYETDNIDPNNLKYQKIVDILKDKYDINEENGIYTIDKIKEIVCNTISKYKDNINYCYLYGSYAKGYAKDNSDVDLCIDTTLTGMKFVGFIEELHQALKKNVDVIRINDLKDNFDLINEIMKDGIKLYG